MRHVLSGPSPVNHAVEGTDTQPLEAPSKEAVPGVPVSARKIAHLVQAECCVWRLDKGSESCARGAVTIKISHAVQGEHCAWRLDKGSGSVPGVQSAQAKIRKSRVPNVRE